MPWFKPIPQDDVMQSGGSDDDDLSPGFLLGRVFGQMLGGVGIHNDGGYDSLNGPHFRVGWLFYKGARDPWPMNQATMNQSTLYDGALMTAPPIIPHTSVTERAINQGLYGSGEWPGYVSWPQPLPLTTRRG